MQEESQQAEAQQTRMAHEPLFFALDIPTDTTPDAAAALLGEPFARGFRVLSIVPWSSASVGARVFMERTGARPPVQHRRRIRDEHNDAAIAIIRQHPDCSIRATVLLLRSKGIMRSQEWVRLRKKYIYG